MAVIGPDVVLDRPAYVHDSAHLYGKVRIGENASIWVNVVARAEHREIISIYWIRAAWPWPSSQLISCCSWKAHSFFKLLKKISIGDCPRSFPYGASNRSPILDSLSATAR